MEVVVALSILSIIFVIGSQVWMHAVVMRHPSTEFILRSHMRALCMESGLSLEADNSRHEYPAYHCIRSISPEGVGKGLYRVSVTCYRGEEQIGQRQRIIKQDEITGIHHN